MTAVNTSRIRRIGPTDIGTRVHQLAQRHEYLILTVAWLLLAVWVWQRLDQGWVAHDDGAFGQSAVRLLDGQLPHREFAELYTGGLTFLNAAMLLLFREDLLVLRYPLFAVFLCLVPAAYYVARSVAGSLTALLATAVVATWSIPVYPAAVPSWYLLAFAILGAASLVRWRSTGNNRWLFLCGVLGGLSIAFKIVGVYFVVAVVMLLVVAYPGAQRERRWWRGAIVPIAATAMAAGLVVSVLGGRYGAAELVNLVVPIAAVVIASWFGHMRGADGFFDGPPPGSLARSLAVLAAGSAIPIGVLLCPYIVAGATHDLVAGIFVSPQSRREFAYLATPDPAQLLVALWLAALLLVRSRVTARTKKLMDVAVSLLAVLLLAVAMSLPVGYKAFWVGGRGLGPVVVVVGALVVIARLRSARALHGPVFLLLSLVAFMSLTQYPYAGAVYYCYVAPLVVLAAVAVSSATTLNGSWLVPVLLACFACFGAVALDRSSLYALGYGYARDPQVVVLDEDRASIRVFPKQRDQVLTVVDLLRAHTSGRFVYAGPDLPHVYFLADRDNPTRSLFDFLDTSGSARGDALLGALRRSGVTAIAIDREPDFSDPLEADTLASLRSRYPLHRVVGGIEVRWAMPHE